MKRFFIYIIFTFSYFISDGQSINLNIEGYSEKETVLIDSIGYTKSFKNYVDLKLELDSTLLKIEKLGYYNKELKEFFKTNDSTYKAIIQVNNKFTYIHIYYNGIAEKEALRKFVLDPEQDFFKLKVDDIKATLNYLVSRMSADGNPFYSLQLKEIQKLNDSTLKAKLTSVSKSKRKIDKIIVKGYERFPKSFLMHYLRLKQNSTFNLETIKMRTADLNNLRFAKQKKEPEVLFTPDSTLLYIYVEKTRSNTFDGFIGFGTNEETNKLQFDGYLNLNLTNALNYGEQISLFYKSDENDQRTFDVKLNLPYLFKSPLGIAANLNIFKRDTSFLSITQKVSLQYITSPRSTFSIGLSSIKSDNLNAISSSSIEDFKTTFYQGGYNYINRDNFEVLFPINFYLDLSAGFGKRDTDLKEADQTSLELETHKIFNLNNRNSLYGRLTGGYLISDDYLINELFRFGGINSIRGFEENSLLANLYSVLNTEYRYRLNSSFYVHTVFDAAYAENQIADTKDKLFGFGFGFGLLTNSGLLKFNYSGSKVNDQRINISDFKIHLSLSASF